MIRILQLNLNHCRAAQELLRQSVRELNVDIALLSEPYRCVESSNWVSDVSCTSAIWSVSGLTVRDAASQQCGYARATVSGITLYSCYIPPRYSIEEFQFIVDGIASDAITREPVLIAGDFNAWAIEWGCPRTNPRGRVLLEALSALGVVLMNIGNEQTFSRGVGGSTIDVTFASSSIAERVHWSISDQYTHSDHSAIIIDVAHGQPHVNTTTQSLTGWKANTFDKNVFAIVMESMVLEGPAEAMANQLINGITQACNASMVKRSRSANKQPVYWWNDEIANMRIDCIRARRLYTRSRGRPENSLHHQVFKTKRRAFKLAIRKSKRRCFLEICDEVENNPWGLAYKLVTKRLKCLNPTSPKEESILKGIVEHLFPQQEISSWEDSVVDEVYHFPQVTISEIEAAVSKFKDKKAPGLDCIPNSVLKEAVRCCPEQFVRMISTCLSRGVFPSIWKRQRLVLLPKDKKPPDDPSSYRPLCMIDTCGKLLESIVCRRLECCIEAVSGLSENQFGFRKAKSTIDAINLVVETAAQAIEGKRWRNGTKEYCVIVTLDVKNAFNTANWEKIVGALSRLNIPRYLMAIIQDYFRNRLLIYDTDTGTKRYKITGGVPQGSVLGPLLWNVMYDGVLRLVLPANVKIIGFADDIALVSVAKELPDAVTITNVSIQIVRSWLRSMGLNLADHKTESVLISSRKRRETIKLDIGTCCIETKPYLKYLGVMIDTRLSFFDHLKYISAKASKTCSALSRIMPNTRGPKYLQRKLIMNVVKSIILYASPIWAGALRFVTYANVITPVYRLAALRVCSAFRTVSDEAAFVIAGMLPIDLEATSTVAARDESIARWQLRWSNSDKGRWTYLLISDIVTWLDRGHGDLDYYITQLLSGHGCFRSYLCRFGHDSDPFCPSCDGNVVEDAYHVFFTCPRFRDWRMDLEQAIGHSVRPDNIVQAMLSSLGNWAHVCNFAKLVLVELRRLERIRSRIDIV